MSLSTWQIADWRIKVLSALVRQSQSVLHGGDHQSWTDWLLQNDCPVRVCFDFGHAHIMNTVARDFELVKDYVRSTHVHDNNRDRDAHLWPGSGGIDWKEAMDLLRSAHHAPAVLMEIDGQDNEQADVPAAMAQAFKKLEVA